MQELVKSSSRQELYPTWGAATPAPRQTSSLQSHHADLLLCNAVAPRRESVWNAIHEDRQSQLRLAARRRASPQLATAIHRLRDRSRLRRNSTSAQTTAS